MKQLSAHALDAVMRAHFVPAVEDFLDVKSMPVWWEFWVTPTRVNLHLAAYAKRPREHYPRAISTTVRFDSRGEAAEVSNRMERAVFRACKRIKKEIQLERRLTL